MKKSVIFSASLLSSLAIGGLNVLSIYGEEGDIEPISSNSNEQITGNVEVTSTEVSLPISDSEMYEKNTGEDLGQTYIADDSEKNKQEGSIFQNDEESLDLNLFKSDSDSDEMVPLSKEIEIESIVYGATGNSEKSTTLSDSMYRLYNPNSGEHFYTNNNSERINLVNLGWRYEGIGWMAPRAGEAVYRLYNPNAGDHHYTLNNAEKNMLVQLGWNDEGIGWYSDTANGIKLFRVYNPNAVAGSHHYTTDENEYNHLISIGWQAEGISWYGTNETPPQSSNTWISSNDYLSTNQMQNNAQLVWNFFQVQGWTLNAVAGILGNMQVESNINPGLWEGRYENNPTVGFGLVQWTPAIKVIQWLNQRGFEANDGYGQCLKILDEFNNGGQYYSTSAYPLNFFQFAHSLETPEYLAQAFLNNYERPANKYQPLRSQYARYWYDFLK